MSNNIYLIGLEVQAVNVTEPASYWLWIGIAGGATLIFGVMFILSLNRYRRLCAKARRMERRRARAYDENGLAEDEAMGDYQNMDRQFQNAAMQNDFQNAAMDNHFQDGAQSQNGTASNAGRGSDQNYGATAALDNAAGFENAGDLYPHTEEDKTPRQAPGVYVGKVHNIGRRSSQQDSFGISQDGPVLSASGKGLFAIVADGMGGLSNGGEVSARVTMSMMSSFDRMNGQERGDKQLLAMLNQANDDVNAMLKSAGQGKSGSTVVAVLLRGSLMSWITVGDSHIYLYREEALMQVNRDHVYSVELDEMAARGEISAQEAAGDPQRKALTSYIGMGKLAKIDRNIRPLQLKSRDRILLMTDGVFGTLTDEEITAAMKLPVTESCNALDQMIQGKNRSAQDNYTALILEYI